MKLHNIVGALALLGARLAVAQQNTVTNTAEELDNSVSDSIPTGISTQCRDYLTSFNSDTQIQACTEGLVDATRLYSVTATNKATTSSDTQQLDQTLSNLCSGSAGCNSDLIRQSIAKFWDNCHSELQSDNADVKALYDYLYMLNPLKDAICSKDTANNYCLKSVAKTAASTGASRRSLVEDLEPESSYQELSRRQAASNSSNTAFLYLSPDSDPDLLCSECAQNILAAYVAFETSIPYGTGLQNSDKLKIQSELFRAGKSKCGKNFATNVNHIANVTFSGGNINGAETKTVKLSLAVAAAGIVSTGLLL